MQVNKKEKAGKEWLAEYCKKLNDFPKGKYIFQLPRKAVMNITSHSLHTNESMLHSLYKRFSVIAQPKQ